jgi:hypothetical protein
VRRRQAIADIWANESVADWQRRSATGEKTPAKGRK